MTKNHDIRIFSDATDLFQFAANDFYQRATSAINDKGEFSVVLAGGNTPKLFFDTLTDTQNKKNIPWQRIKFFFGDERYVPADNERSNYHMAWKYLFSKVPVNIENIFRIPTELNNPKDAAHEYELTLRKAFNISENDLPQFDLVYLGLGEDAHTASLMPLSDVVKRYMEDKLADKNNQLVASLFIAESNMYRITLTPTAINNAKNIIFFVTGANKADAAWRVLKGPNDPLHNPAQLIHPVNTSWYLDQAAAEKLNLK